MKILWLGVYASWTGTLLKELARKNEVTMIIPSNKTETRVENGATIYSISIPENESKGIMSENVFNKYNQLISIVNPDIIHVHGVEKNLGQIQNFIKNIPVVISIQGILGGCLPFDTGYIREEEIVRFRTVKNALGYGGYKELHRTCLKGHNTYEKEILERGKYFFCRTNWDKAWVTFSNPIAIIYQGEELLRTPFYEYAGTWNIKSCKKHTIFMPSGFNPIKGLHIALKTIVLLKKIYPDVTLVVPGLPKRILEYEGFKARVVGEEFINYCKDIIRKNNIEDNVILLDRLDAEGMATEMKNANVFLSPSTIDNSSNAVGEAMMIGLPIVCTPVGGMTSFMHDEDNCLFAPAGDEYIAAYQIKRIFDNMELASRLGKSAHETALQRHDKDSTTKQYLVAYEDIICHFKENFNK